MILSHRLDIAVVLFTGMFQESEASLLFFFFKLSSPSSQAPLHLLGVNGHLNLLSNDTQPLPTEQLKSSESFSVVQAHRGLLQEPSWGGRGEALVPWASLSLAAALVGQNDLLPEG